MLNPSFQRCRVRRCGAAGGAAGVVEGRTVEGVVESPRVMPEPWKREGGAGVGSLSAREACLEGS